jgi:hypothetical protein
MYGGPPQGPPQGPPPGPYGYGPPSPQQQQYPQQQQQPYYVQAPPPVVYVQNNTMKAPFNHTVHIVLDFVTCGGWLIVHLICYLAH